METQPFDFGAVEQATKKILAAATHANLERFFGNVVVISCDSEDVPLAMERVRAAGFHNVSHKQLPGYASEIAVVV